MFGSTSMEQKCNPSQLVVLPLWLDAVTSVRVLSFLFISIYMARVAILSHPLIIALKGHVLLYRCVVGQRFYLPQNYRFEALQSHFLALVNLECMCAWQMVKKNEWKFCSHFSLHSSAQGVTQKMVARNSDKVFPVSLFKRVPLEMIYWTCHTVSFLDGNPTLCCYELVVYEVYFEDINPIISLFLWSRN